MASLPASAAKPLGLVLCVAVAAAVALWCGDEAAAAAAKVDPCSVLTQADIQSAFGAAPTDKGKRDDMGVIDGCDWPMPNGGSLSLTLYTTPVGTPRVSSRTARDKAYEEVAGLGAGAAYKDDSNPPVIPVSETVEVVTDQRHFDVQYVNATPGISGQYKDRLVALARTVLARLR